MEGGGMGFGESVGGGVSSMMMPTFMSFSPFSSNPNTSATNTTTTNTHNSSLLLNKDNNPQQRCYFMDNNNIETDTAAFGSMKVQIMSHPLYPRLLAAYINCQKIGAPPEVLARLEEACTSEATYGRVPRRDSIGEDPALDQFMEAYCEMLAKYEQELTKPFKEAMMFLSRIECQFKALTVSSNSGDDPLFSYFYFLGHFEAADLNEKFEENVDVSDHYIDPQAEDRELKLKLLRKYSGYLGGLKQEFMKKKKKGKLPKEARQKLHDWWSRHHKWPYPSESQKLALAECTGLDPRQINNWFINQRKRHWKPSEELQFAVMEGMQPHYYIDNMLANPFSMDGTPLL
ncbi:hypothetical protein IFM89_003996 [Coptis chinensis]|uniref:Uncharacterized protein n=1 Tax=Coptis chinensis TaxID=261450 RepID=A0A835GX29_9MAGN|nr:hypothetical protein IFM89_003996 [Coptis chinensis]